MKSTSANATIPVLDKLISIFGVPKVVKTDNGSPFNSHAFKEFSENLGCQHTRITPRWPKANAQAEAFNKQMMKAVCAVHIERKNRKQDLIYSSSFANTGEYYTHQLDFHHLHCSSIERLGPNFHKPRPVNQTL